MADNVAITAGTGTTIAADEVTDGTLGSVKVQYVKLMDGTLDGTTKATVGANGLKVDPLPSGITPVVSSAAESNHVIKASAGVLHDWHVTTGANAGYVMIFNATSAPADGAVTPIVCVAAAASNTAYSPPMLAPTTFSTGITMVFSTTGPFTKTASATAFFSAKAV